MKRAILPTLELLRPWLRVAQPDDWTGSLVRLATWPVYFGVLLPVAIGRIPESWRILDIEVLTRVAMGLSLIYVLGWVRALVFASLPKAAIQFGGRVWFRHHGRRMVVRIADVVAIDVELRPGGEVFVLEIAGVGTVDLCPLEWEGAQRIYRVVDRRVKRARRRRARRGG